MLPPLRRPARWNTFRESHEGMTNAIESANHIRKRMTNMATARSTVKLESQE
jgi:hypothetical protein